MNKMFQIGVVIRNIGHFNWMYVVNNVPEPSDNSWTNFSE